MLFYFSGGSGADAEMVFTLYGEEPFHWNALKPVTVYGFPNGFGYESGNPPLLRLRVDAAGIWLEACRCTFPDPPLDRVRVFTREEAGRRFRCFRFVWAPDGRRVRLEADGEIVAAADLVKKKLIVRGGDGRAASSGGWSPQGHDWDDSLLEEFDRSPEKPLCKPLWRPVRKLTAPVRLYLFLTTYFGLVTFWIAVGLAGARYVTFAQALFGWIALRSANRIVQCFANPWKIRMEAAIPNPGEPSPQERDAAVAARNRLVTKYLLYLLPAVTGLCGLLPEWIPWAAIVAVYSSRYVSTLLDLLGLRSPERRSFDRLLEMNGYQWEVRRQLLRSHVPKIPFLVQVMKKHCAGKRVIIGVSERFGRTAEYDEAAEIVTGPLREQAEAAGVTPVFVADGLTSAALDASFGKVGDAAAFFSFSAGWKAWTGTALWQRPKEERPAIFVTEITAMEFREAFEAIRDGRLLGAGIAALKRDHLDLASLLPEELRQPGDDAVRIARVKTANLLPVDRDNLDAVLEMLVKSGLETFRPLLPPGRRGS